LNANVLEMKDDDFAKGSVKPPEEVI